MGLSSTLKTEYSKDIKVKGTAGDFNEAIYDGFETTGGWDFDDVATITSATLKTSGGRDVPEVAKFNKKGEFCFLGYEADQPEPYAFMYANFHKAMAQVIADNIDFGCLILSHEVEGNGTEYYFISPGVVEEVDIVKAILDGRDLSGFTK